LTVFRDHLFRNIAGSGGATSHLRKAIKSSAGMLIDCGTEQAVTCCLPTGRQAGFEQWGPRWR